MVLRQSRGANPPGRKGDVNSRMLGNEFELTGDVFHLVVVEHLEVHGCALGQVGLVGNVHSQPNPRLAVKVIGSETHAVALGVRHFYELQLVAAFRPAAEGFRAQIRHYCWALGLGVIGGDP